MIRLTTRLFLLPILPLFLLPGVSLADPDEILRMEERLEEIEREAEQLRSDIRLMKQQAGEDVGTDDDWEQGIVGTWSCTNNVFDYELSLQQNGQAIIKEMSSKRTEQGTWTRRGDNDIVLSNPGYRGSGMAESYEIKDISEKEMSLVEPNTGSVYDCEKISAR